MGIKGAGGGVKGVNSFTFPLSSIKQYNKQIALISVYVSFYVPLTGVTGVVGAEAGAEYTWSLSESK